MHQAKSLLVLLATTAVGITSATAQCNPTNGTCDPILGFAEEYHIDFSNTSSLPGEWILADSETVTFSDKGVEFSLAKRNDAPTIWTDAYLFFGSVEVVLQTAPGVGVITSAVLLSDTLDEIDWEWSGNDFGQDKPTVQTNYYGMGRTGNWDRGTQPHVADNMTQGYHAYRIDWTAETLTWSFDGTVLRTLNAKDCDDGDHRYPQTPARFHLGVWDGGDPDTPWYTVQWAGGHTDLNGMPYNAYVRGVTIKPASPCYKYQYTDENGSKGSVKCLETSAPKSTATTSTAASNTPRTLASVSMRGANSGPDEEVTTVEKVVKTTEGCEEEDTTIFIKSTRTKPKSSPPAPSSLTTSTRSTTSTPTPSTETTTVSTSSTCTTSSVTLSTPPPGDSTITSTTTSTVPCSSCSGSSYTTTTTTVPPASQSTSTGIVMSDTTTSASIPPPSTTQSTSTGIVVSDSSTLSTSEPPPPSSAQSTPTSSGIVASGSTTESPPPATATTYIGSPPPKKLVSQSISTYPTPSTQPVTSPSSSSQPPPPSSSSSVTSTGTVVSAPPASYPSSPPPSSESLSSSPPPSPSSLSSGPPPNQSYPGSSPPPPPPGSSSPSSSPPPSAASIHSTVLNTPQILTLSSLTCTTTSKPPAGLVNSSTPPGENIEETPYPTNPTDVDDGGSNGTALPTISFHASVPSTPYITAGAAGLVFCLGYMLAGFVGVVMMGVLGVV